MELVTAMEWLQHYWWIIAVVAVVVLAFILLRPRQRVRLTDSTPERPHMAYSAPPPEGRGLGGEAASAASDMAGEIIDAPVRAALDGKVGHHDDLSRIKGVGPKFAAALQGLGFHRFEQIAALSEPEIERLDGQLGPFAGRMKRDKIVEQADYLARNDIDGFEQRFGKL
jgi:predicted flap endonuclease-1-like 5' DNA nuclease